MKKILRTIAILIIIAGLLFGVGSLGIWFSLGAHVGWSKTYIEEAKQDEITGIEYVERIDKFVPGVDFLIPAIIAGFVCIVGGAVILSRTKE